MPDQTFADFLDSFRESRQITRQDFVKDIVSERQYHRFIKGQSNLSSEVLIKLLDRLGTNLPMLLQKYSEYSSEAKINLKHIFSLVREHNYKGANDSLIKLDTSTLKTKYEKDFYCMLEIIISDKLGKMGINQSVEKMKKLINYPELLNNSVITIIEFNGLLFIDKYLIAEKKKSKISAFMYQVLTTPNSSFAEENTDLLPGMYWNVSRSLGAVSEYEKSYIIAKKGIKHCKKSGSMSFYPTLLTTKALSERNLNLDFTETLIQLFSYIRAINDASTTQKFTSYIYSKFQVKSSDLITYK